MQSAKSNKNLHKSTIMVLLMVSVPLLMMSIGGGVMAEPEGRPQLTDDGLFWSDAQRVTTDPSADSNPQLAVDAKGDSHLIWQRAGNYMYKKVDEQGAEYECTADDAAYAIFEMADGVPLQFNSSWCVRVRRDDLLTLQVDGTDGTAVAGLRKCRVQHESFTPRPVWNPDVEQPIDFYADWQEMPANRPYDNAFKAQWELFLKHVVLDDPFRWSLLEGAKGVQLAELGQRSWQQRTWVDVPDLA